MRFFKADVSTQTDNTDIVELKRVTRVVKSLLEVMFVVDGTRFDVHLFIV